MNEENKALPIPPDIMRQIRLALEKEPDVITRTGVILQMQTGLRISEVLSIREGCIIRQMGQHFLQVRLSKTVKGDAVVHRVCVSESGQKAVAELMQATGRLRQASGKKELFLVQNHGIHVASARKWSQVRLQSFVRRHRIVDREGQLYPLHSHQFRATFLHEKILEGERLSLVQTQFRHVSAEMTRHYLTLSGEELAAFYEKGLRMIERGDTRDDRKEDRRIETI